MAKPLPQNNECRRFQIEQIFRVKKVNTRPTLNAGDRIGEIDADFRLTLGNIVAKQSPAKRAVKNLVNKHSSRLQGHIVYYHLAGVRGAKGLEILVADIAFPWKNSVLGHKERGFQYKRMNESTKLHGGGCLPALKKLSLVVRRRNQHRL